MPPCLSLEGTLTLLGQVMWLLNLASKRWIFPGFPGHTRLRRPFTWRSMIRVTAVYPDSIAAELGLQDGTELVSVNGRELEDFLDWEFLTAEEAFVLHVRQPGGEEIEFDIERPLGESMGVSLEPAADSPLRQPLRLLLCRRLAGRTTRCPLHSG